MNNRHDHTDIQEFLPDPSEPLALLKACPVYTASPLTTLVLDNGTKVLAKDETNRMGLGAFKALGGPYAVVKLIQQAWFDQYGQELPVSRLFDDDVKDFAGKMTFVCASAGNHGVGVAAGARAFNARARIYLAKTVPQNFAKRLSEFNAQVVIAGENYQESVAQASMDAENTGAILLADGSWPGYTNIPRFVMEGYTVIAEELRQEFENSGNWPDVVYLQAGVGGLAAAIAFMIRKNWLKQPEIIVVEPQAAPCLKASSQAGVSTKVEGSDSNMGRLDCKEPSLVAWQTLEKCDVSYQTISDDEAEQAATKVSKLGIATTPSGAAGFAAMITTDKTPSNPLVFITEGSS